VSVVWRWYVVDNDARVVLAYKVRQVQSAAAQVVDVPGNNDESSLFERYPEKLDQVVIRIEDRDDNWRPPHGLSYIKVHTVVTAELCCLEKAEAEGAHPARSSAGECSGAHVVDRRALHAGASRP
jgi:hypothetical protein